MKNITDTTNERALKALKKLNCLEAIRYRLESVYDTKTFLHRYGFTPELLEIIVDNGETQAELIERFIRF